MRVNKGNIAHHLGVLVEAGLVRKGPTRTVRGGTEQYFVKTARRVKFAPGENGEATNAMLGTIADEIPGDDDSLLVHDLPNAPREAEYGVLAGVYRRG